MEKQNDNYTKILTLRFTQKEYESLEKKAEKNNIRLSQLIRTLIFRRELLEKSYSEQNGRTETIGMLLQNVSSDIEQTNQEIGKIRETYSRSLSLKDRNGQRVITEERTARYVQSVEMMLEKIKQSLDVVRNSVKESGEKTGAANVAIDTELNDGIYTFRAFLSGTICSKISEYDRFGEKRICFDMMVNEVSSRGRWTYTVSVDAPRPDYVSQLRVGQGISAFGNLHIELEGGNKSASIPELKISLYSNRLKRT